MEGIEGIESDRLHARSKSHDKNNIKPHNIKKAIDSNKIYLFHHVNSSANTRDCCRNTKTKNIVY